MKNLILLHGALGSSAQFIELEKLLMGSYKIYKFDFLGHGKYSSAKHNELTINKLIIQLRKFINENRLYKPDVFAYSMGAYVALSLEAISDRSIFNKLITLGSKLNWNEEIGKSEISKLNADNILEKVPKFAEYLISLHGDNWKNMLKANINIINNISKHPILSKESYKLIDCPTVLALGEHDDMVSKEETEYASTFIPNSEFHIVKDIKHPIQSIKPEVLAELIISKLN